MPTISSCRFHVHVKQGGGIVGSEVYRKGSAAFSNPRYELLNGASRWGLCAQGWQGCKSVTVGVSQDGTNTS